jgi:fucose permease
MKRNARVLLIGIAFSGFVALGLSSGLLGVAWPSIRASFGLSLDAVGTLLVAITAGSLLSSFSSGPIVSRIGAGSLLLIASVLMGVGRLGYSLAPTWWVLVLFGVFSGMGAGAIDAGLNTYFAANHSASLMNWLHACYGLGATLGPIVMTTVLNMGQSWRWGYVVAGVLQGLLALSFGLTLPQWRLAGANSPEARSRSFVDGVRTADTLRLPTVWLGIALFFVLTGVEGTAGQWPYTLFTEGRGVAPSAAGMWVSIYWGSLTVGRILFGFVVDRLGVVSSARLCLIGVILGAACVWWNVTDVVGFLGLALIGFSLAPLFPLLISHTPRRLGAAHAPNAIGFQVAAAGLGLSLVPGSAGVLADSLGLEIIGPFLLAGAIATFLLHEVIVSRRS